MKKIIYITILSVFLGISCMDLDLEPTETVSGTQVNELGLVEPFIQGINSTLYTYSRTNFDGVGGYPSLMAAASLWGNDAVFVQGMTIWLGFDYTLMDRVASWPRTLAIWEMYYTIIRDANAIIKNTNNVTDMEDNVATARGQALFFRAFSYFYLANYYQHRYIDHQDKPCVPIITEDTEDFQPRARVDSVYNLIVSDLNRAYELLEDKNVTGNTNVSINVVCGMLARVYLTMEEYDDAAHYANLARQGYTLMNEEEYLSGFSNVEIDEWMWGYNVPAEEKIGFRSFFSHMSTLGFGYAGLSGKRVAISSELYDQISSTDFRKKAFNGPDQATVWSPSMSRDFTVNPYDNLKFYEDVMELGDVCYMRAAEMYLIEAEALARSGEGDPAQVLYDLVSTRDPNYVKSTNTGNDLIEEILLHRRIELWGEGFDYFDLKRLNRGINRGGNHPIPQLSLPAGSNEFVYQIPLDEIQSNEMINESDQNPL